eukprot:365325-Chlamydomonas_euryale.AAC.7
MPGVHADLFDARLGFAAHSAGLQKENPHHRRMGGLARGNTLYTFKVPSWCDSVAVSESEYGVGITCVYHVM